jgi:transposase
VQATNREISRTWIATGQTDMRKGMQGLSLLVQESLGRAPFAGDVFVFLGRGGSLITALWHGLFCAWTAVALSSRALHSQRR